MIIEQPVGEWRHPNDQYPEFVFKEVQTSETVDDKVCVVAIHETGDIAAMEFGAKETMDIKPSEINIKEDICSFTDAALPRNHAAIEGAALSIVHLMTSKTTPR